MFGVRAVADRAEPIESGRVLTRRIAVGTTARTPLTQFESQFATKLFCSFVVRDHLVKEHPVLVGKMMEANMRFTNMCTVSYAGMKGFSDRIYGVTNSPKTRNYYPSVRYLKDDAILETILTGNIPSNA